MCIRDRRRTTWGIGSASVTDRGEGVGAAVGVVGATEAGFAPWVAGPAGARVAPAGGTATTGCSDEAMAASLAPSPCRSLVPRSPAGVGDLVSVRSGR